MWFAVGGMKRQGKSQYGPDVAEPRGEGNAWSKVLSLLSLQLTFPRRFVFKVLRGQKGAETQVLGRVSGTFDPSITLNPANLTYERLNKFC